MSMMINSYAFATPVVDDLADLFANGEIGDWWRFDNAHTDAATVGSSITKATGLINGRILEDGYPANLPTLQQISGRYVADFDGIGDRLFHSFGSTIAQPGTIIICLRDSDTTTHAILTGSSSTSRWQISVDSSGNLIAFAGTSLDSTINQNFGTKVLAVEFNGASTKFRVNGTQVATGNAGTQSTNRLTIGAVYDGTAGGEIEVYSALFINRPLTAGELDRAERLLGSHAGLAW